MALSTDLISQFVKVTNDDKKQSTETTLYGTIVKDGSSVSVKLDGSSTTTPISNLSLTTNVKNGDRVTVMIKNHTATITGNLTSPAPRNEDVADASKVANQITQLEIAIADTVKTSQLQAEQARISSLETETATINQKLTASNASIKNLETDNATVNETLTANTAAIESLKTTKLDAEIANTTYATIENLKATNTEVYNLQVTYGNFENLTTEKLAANTAAIAELETNKLSTEEAKITYANIDFSNIGKAAMEYFYANSGLIENVVISDGTITGFLAGVTIKGDLIEANTLVADKLVILGEDGLYYKLNTNGMVTEAEQTEYNSLNGSIITAKSITANKINVDDLVAFDATIGGFNITEDAIFSEVKDDVGNTVRGTYMDKEGQFNFGDSDNFVKYYRDDEGNFHLAISAETIMYTLNGTRKSIADLGVIGEYVKIGTYEDEPCIELGESDSDFKLLITNTRMLFMEGSSIVAYITNQSLHIKKAVIEEELQQGGFVWKVRSNGNMGLMWKGVSG